MIKKRNLIFMIAAIIVIALLCGATAILLRVFSPSQKSVTQPLQAKNSVQTSASEEYASVSTVGDLITRATSGGKVSLSASIKLSTTLEVTGDLTLDLNGETLSIDKGAWKSAIKVNSEATFTLKDSVGGGMISGGCHRDAAGGGVYVDGGTFNMSGGTITDNEALNSVGGGVYVDGGTFNMSGGSISGNKAIQGGGGVFVKGGTFTMSGGTITGNKASSFGGGGVFVNGGTFTMEGGSISGNTSKYGGGVGVSDGKFIMSSGTITGNEASRSGGGGVSIYGSISVFTMKGGTIGGSGESEKNTSATNGGGVRIESGTFNMEGGSISDNTSKYGGGVYLENGKFNMVIGSNNQTGEETAGTITGNRATEDGGGVYVASGRTFTMSGGSISSNKSTYSGGGVLVNKNATFIMNGGSIVGNSADYGGGVRVNENASFVMSDGSISNNKATFDGGGLCVCNAKKIELGDTSGIASIDSNLAAAGGGIYFETSSAQQGSCSYKVVGKTYMQHNHVKTYDSSEPKYAYTGKGGGIYIDGGSVSIDGGMVMNNVADKDGGGIYADGSLVVGGGVMFTNNKIKISDDNSAKNNVYLTGDKTISVTGAFESWTKIGVVNTGEIATGYTYNTESPSTYFIPDDSAYSCVSVKNGAVTVAAHTGGTATCTAKATCSVCGEQYGEINANNHSFAAEWTSDGSKHWHAATCGHDVKSDEASHTETTDAAVAATCTEKGKTEGSHCSVCSKVLTAQTEIAARGHDYSSAWTSDGSKHWHECANGCGIKSEEGEHGGGTATCTAKAECSTCGAEYGELNADNHSFSSAWTSDGSKHWHAATCGHDVKSDEASHTEDGGTVTKAASCTEKGVKTYKCSVCEYVIRTEEIAMIAHTEAVDPAVAATCTEKGKTEGTHCSVCSRILTAQNEIAAIGHSYGEWTVAKQATLDEYGEMKRVCAHDETHTESKPIPKRVPQLAEPNRDGGEEDDVIVTMPNGFAHDVELVVTQVEKEGLAQYETIANGANGQVEVVYDVTLMSNGVSIQPDGTLTVKLRIPAELKGKAFKLFHLHGGEATETAYTVSGSYAVLTTDRLSEFIFVGDKPSVAEDEHRALWITLIFVFGAAIALEIGVIVYRKTRMFRVRRSK